MPVLGIGAISIPCIQKYKDRVLSERTAVWLLWEGTYKYSEEKRGIVYARAWSSEAADLAWALNCEIMDAWWMIPGQGQGERIYLWPLGLKYWITYWSTSAPLFSSPPSPTPQHDVHFAEPECPSWHWVFWAAASRLTSTMLSGSWVSSEKMVRMRMLIVLLIRFAKSFQYLQHKTCSCAVLCWVEQPRVAVRRWCVFHIRQFVGA